MWASNFDAMNVLRRHKNKFYNLYHKIFNILDLVGLSELFNSEIPIRIPKAKIQIDKLTKSIYTKWQYVSSNCFLYSYWYFLLYFKIPQLFSSIIHHSSSVWIFGCFPFMVWLFDYLNSIDDSKTLINNILLRIILSVLLTAVSISYKWRDKKLQFDA